MSKTELRKKVVDDKRRKSKRVKSMRNVKLLDPGNYNLVNVFGDGNCFYRAIIYYLASSETEHRVVRLQTCRYLKKNAIKIATQFALDGFPITRGDIITLAKEHRVNGVFTDHELIQHTVMKVYGIKIRIYFDNSGWWNPTNCNADDACNLLCRREHFQLMVPKYLV
jgi:hypothetical protein